MTVSAITWAKVIMTLREPNWFVHLDFQLGDAKKQDAILGGKKIRLCFFLLSALLFFLYCMSFWRDKLLNSACEFAPSLFRGGGGGLDLKAEEVSLPSWGLLCYFFSLVGCRHLPYEC